MRPREPRYVGAELATAVRRWCEREVLRLSGGRLTWNDPNDSYLRASLETSSAKAHELASQILTWRRAAVRFLDRCKGEGHGDVALIRLAVKALVGLPTLREGQRPIRLVPRDYLVLEWDKPRCWWWSGRAPDVRDLAILSLLAGNGADATALSTVNEAVRAEEKAVRLARKRWSKTAH